MSQPTDEMETAPQRASAGPVRVALDVQDVALLAALGLLVGGGWLLAGLGAALLAVGAWLLYLAAPKGRG